jgi:hypothetical protein
MNAKEAKDFLAQQTTEQAVLENVPLSDLEKRMMYFVENDPTSCSDPVELHDEFEAQYDTQQFEAKIGGLLRRAYGRLKKENPTKVRNWNDAVQTLCRGDHYLPVLLRKVPSDESGWRSPANRVIRCGSIAVALFFVAVKISEVPNLPQWVFGLLISLFLLFLLLTLVFLAQQGYRALHRPKT